MLMWSLILLLRNHALTGISFGFGFLHVRIDSQNLLWT